MLYNYENRNLLEAGEIHDSVFNGCYFDYNSRVLQFSCENTYLGKRFAFSFFQVIYVNMKCCDLWPGGDNRILWIDLMEERPMLHELRKQKEAEQARHNADTTAPPEETESPALFLMQPPGPERGLRDEVEYLELELQLSTGDTLHIVCEAFSLEALPL